MSSISNLIPETADQNADPSVLLAEVKNVFASINNTLMSIVKMTRDTGMSKDETAAHERQADAVVEASSGISKIELQTLSTTQDLLMEMKNNSKLIATSSKSFLDGFDKVVNMLNDRLPRNQEKTLVESKPAVVEEKQKTVEQTENMFSVFVKKTGDVLNSLTATTTNIANTWVNAAKESAKKDKLSFGVPQPVVSLAPQISETTGTTAAPEQIQPPTLDTLETAENKREEKPSGLDLKGLIKGIGESPVFERIADATKVTATKIGELASGLWSFLIGIAGSIIAAIAPFLPEIIALGVGIGLVVAGISKLWSVGAETVKLLQDNKKEIDRQAKVSDNEISRLETEKKNLADEKEKINNDSSLSPEEKTQKLEELSAKQQNTERKLVGTQEIKAQGKLNDASRGLFDIGETGEALASSVPGGAAAVSVAQYFGIIDDNTKKAEAKKEIEAKKKELGEINAIQRISENQKMLTEFDKSTKQPIFVNSPTTNTSVSNGQSVMIAPSNTTQTPLRTF